MREEPWRSAFFAALGVTVAVLLLVEAQVSGPASPPTQPAWPSSYPFGQSGQEVIPPHSVGAGVGWGTNESCQYLFVEFNATYPIDLWVTPGNSSVIFHNGTPFFTAILWSVGPATMGKNEIKLAHGGGYGVWTANPGPNETAAYWSDETRACP